MSEQCRSALGLVRAYIKQNIPALFSQHPVTLPPMSSPSNSFSPVFRQIEDRNAWRRRFAWARVMAALDPLEAVRGGPGDIDRAVQLTIARSGWLPAVPPWQNHSRDRGCSPPQKLCAYLLNIPGPAYAPTLDVAGTSVTLLAQSHSQSCLVFSCLSSATTTVYRRCHALRSSCAYRDDLRATATLPRTYTLTDLAASAPAASTPHT